MQNFWTDLFVLAGKMVLLFVHWSIVTDQIWSITISCRKPIRSKIWILPLISPKSISIFHACWTLKVSRAAGFLAVAGGGLFDLHTVFTSVFYGVNGIIYLVFSPKGANFSAWWEISAAGDFWTWEDVTFVVHENVGGDGRVQLKTNETTKSTAVCRTKKYGLDRCKYVMDRSGQRNTLQFFPRSQWRWKIVAYIRVQTDWRYYLGPRVSGFS